MNNAIVLPGSNWWECDRFFDPPFPSIPQQSPASAQHTATKFPPSRNVNKKDTIIHNNPHKT
jgi:hypothetical protein